MSRILAISGSLRRGSINSAVLTAAVLLAPQDMLIEIYRGLGDLPLFNPDLEGSVFPAAVAEFRRLVASSDGLLICSPEYARGVAGAMKNALDWLVSATEFPGKPTAVVNASQRSTDADAHLRLTLTTMSARLVTRASIMLPLLGTRYEAGDIVADARFATPLGAALAELAFALRDRPETVD
ncbi:MAG: NAD(P)H-dependent oxidoreductase [Pseudomonadota bacterium]|nr:NAD(P)H-dependent oxidoreductase [Pseudomonadota bacterium]